MVRTARANGIVYRSAASRPDRHAQSLQLLRGVIGQYFDTVPFALCILDRARFILFINAQMAEIIGRSISDLDGLCITGLFPDFSRVLEQNFALAETGQSIPDRRASWLGRSYLLTFSATYDADGMLAEMLIGATDITREVRLQTRLRQSRRQLLASLRRSHPGG